MSDIAMHNIEGYGLMLRIRIALTAGSVILLA